MEIQLIKIHWYATSNSKKTQKHISRDTKTFHPRARGQARTRLRARPNLDLLQVAHSYYGRRAWSTVVNHNGRSQVHMREAKWHIRCCLEVVPAAMHRTREENYRSLNANVLSSLISARWSLFSSFIRKYKRLGASIDQTTREVAMDGCFIWKTHQHGVMKRVGSYQKSYNPLPSFTSKSNLKVTLDFSSTNHRVCSVTSCCCFLYFVDVLTTSVLFFIVIFTLCQTNTTHKL